MKIPTLCRQREKGRPDRAFVSVGGRRRYLGRWGDPAVKERYLRLLAEHDVSGGAVGRPASCPHSITVARVIVSRLDFLKKRHTDAEGNVGQEYYRTRNACRRLYDLYGSTRASEFGPRALAAVRAKMLELGCGRTVNGDLVGPPKPLSRTSANAHTRRILNLFRWAVSVELVDATVYSRLATIEPLKRGDAPEGRQVLPVADEMVEATIPHLTRAVAAMVKLQRLTGARPGEIVQATPAMIRQIDDSLWEYRPTKHKVEHLGRERVIYFGPKCIELVTPFMFRPSDKPLFCPREYTTGGLGDAPPTRNPKTGRRLGLRYTVASYRRAITRACERAGVPAWHPHQLRHTHATETRAIGGIELAAAALGHASIQSSQIYALRSLDAAARLARERA